MISAQEFIARQDRLLAQCEPNSVCIVPAAGMVTEVAIPNIHSGKIATFGI